MLIILDNTIIGSLLIIIINMYTKNMNLIYSIPMFIVILFALITFLYEI